MFHPISNEWDGVTIKASLLVNFVLSAPRAFLHYLATMRKVVGIVAHDCSVSLFYFSMLHCVLADGKFGK